MQYRKFVSVHISHHLCDIVSAEAVTLNDCLQLSYLPSKRNHMLLLYPREILILDLELSQTVGVVAIERSGVPFIQVIYVQIERNYTHVPVGCFSRSGYQQFTNWFECERETFSVFYGYEQRATLTWALTFQLVWVRQKEGHFPCLLSHTSPSP